MDVVVWGKASVLDSIDALNTAEVLDDVGVSDEVDILVCVGILDSGAVSNGVND